MAQDNYVLIVTLTFLLQGLSHVIRAYAAHGRAGRCYWPLNVVLIHQSRADLNQFLRSR